MGGSARDPLPAVGAGGTMWRTVDCAGGRGGSCSTVMAGVGDLGDDRLHD